jgi:hypothetical protein
MSFVEYNIPFERQFIVVSVNIPRQQGYLHYKKSKLDFKLYAEEDNWTEEMEQLADQYRRNAIKFIRFFDEDFDIKIVDPIDLNGYAKGLEIFICIERPPDVLHIKDIKYAAYISGS